MARNPPTDHQLADARKELRRRPRPIPADLSLGRLPAALVAARWRVRELYPALADVPDFMLEAAARLDPPAGCCRWGPARLVARVRRQRVPVNRVTRALLGPMCPGCRAALLPKPKPRPPRPATRSQPGRRSRRPGWPGAARSPAKPRTWSRRQAPRRPPMMIPASSSPRSDRPPTAKVAFWASSLASPVSEVGSASGHPTRSTLVRLAEPAPPAAIGPPRWPARPGRSPRRPPA
jgi:hypothetical protein